MKVAVVGAGIIGVTTAYELAADGHQVSVFERRGSVAAETSFANAGIVGAGIVARWGPTGAALDILSNAFQQHAPVRMRGLPLGSLPWMWRAWRARRPDTQQSIQRNMQQLARFSRDRLHELTRTLKLEYERSDGSLVVLRSAKELSAMQPALAALGACGVRLQTLDARQCRIVEPGLDFDAELHAGILLTNDEVGNCRQFSHLLRTEAQRLGARFRFHTDVKRIGKGPLPQLVHVYAPPDERSAVNAGAERTPADAQDTQPLTQQPVTEGFDAVVLCSAISSSALLRPLGLKLPMQAVHGYSMTAPLRQHEGRIDHGPRSAVVDERYQVVITRLGARVRVSGGTEIGGSPSIHHQGSIDTLYKVLHDWFPGSAHLAQAQHWKGARPTLPDGPPVLGRSGIDGVWLNLGHGACGWALACGSARALADAVAGRPSAVDSGGLGIDRLRR
jgi:D-amino-acid dehydrogenase